MWPMSTGDGAPRERKEDSTQVGFRPSKDANNPRFDLGARQSAGGRIPGCAGAPAPRLERPTQHQTGRCDFKAGLCQGVT